MNCRHAQPLLSDYFEGLLPGRHAARVAAHVNGCSACRRMLDDFRAIGIDLRAPLDWSVMPGLERRISERWFSERAAPANRGLAKLGSGFPAPPRGWLLGAAGAAMLAVGLGVRMGLRRSDPPRSAVVGLPQPAPTPCPPPPLLGEGGRRRDLAQISPPQRRTSTTRARRTSSPSPSIGGGGQGVGARPAPARRASAPAGPGNADRQPPLPLPPDDFIQVAPPLLADLDVTGRQIAAAVSQYQREKAAVDARLARPVTLAMKGTALSDLCTALRQETGVSLTAGPSVADEKVTVFCDRAPLRDVMRQISQPFGYTWLRSGTADGRRQAVDGSPKADGRRQTVDGSSKAEGSEVRSPTADYRLPSTGYRYELEQDLRSQLQEEELRSRERDAALLALDHEVERYRPYLGLSPDEALEQAKNAPTAEKKLLEQLAGAGWGAAQMYFRLSPAEMAELRAGRALIFGSNVTPDPLGRPSFDGKRTADGIDMVLRPLPPEIARGTLQSLRDWRVNEANGTPQFGVPQDVPNGVPVTSWSGARPAVILQLSQDERGQYTLLASSGLALTPEGTHYKLYAGGEPFATGISPAVARPDNRTANARLSHDPALQPLVTVQPQASCGGFRSPVLASLIRQAAGAAPSAKDKVSDMASRKVSTADVLEALHHATGLNLAADYYTRLYPAASVTVRHARLFDALNQLADAMQMRWSKEGGWVRFRTIDDYNDRLKEVPNHLLERWAASRKQNGALTLDDLIEIAQLSDAQLDSREVGEGAWLCYGLEEWFAASHARLRYHLRFLAGLSPAQRRQAQTAAGLPFAQMSLSQQQGFLSLAVERDELQKLRLQDLAGASLRVQYTPPSEYQWLRPAAPGSPLPPSPVHARTREAALTAARRIDPHADMTEIVPTDMDLVFLYTLTGAQSRRVAFR